MARKLTDTVQLKLRFSEALRRRLEREAKRQEQSLNAEIIGRLEQSFRKAEDADLIGSTFRAAFGATGDLLRTLATAIWLIERRTGKKWNEDTDTAFNVQNAIEAIVVALAQPPLTPERVYQIFRGRTDPEELVEFAKRYGTPLEKVEAMAKEIRELNLMHNAALEALQRMGLAPSDALIAEAAKRVQAQEAEQK